jgi:hypothetical protein
MINSQYPWRYHMGSTTDVQMFGSSLIESEPFISASPSFSEKANIKDNSLFTMAESDRLHFWEEEAKKLTTN